MASTTEHTHHIKIRSSQMEMPSSVGNRHEDYDGKLKAAQEELNRIQLQREELERQKSALEELTARKRTFMHHQIELTEKLTNSLTMIDRGLVEIRKESEELEQCRSAFAEHLNKVSKINPEAWNQYDLSEKLERASATIDIADDEYDQAAAYFEGGRSGAIFGNTSKRGRHGRNIENSEFIINLKNGFAFNLPLLIIGALALIVYLIK
jgi:chromosome segregation ATPase